jgi:hypothetical protein
MKPINRAYLNSRGEPMTDEITTLSTLPTIYGCCGLFDLCSDQDLMSLSFEGTSKFMDWIGWERTNVCIIKKNFITWIRPEETAQHGRSHGYIADPCGESNGVEWGFCDFTLEDFGLLRRHGPERNATRTGSGLKLCEIQPRYRLDGTPIVSDVEFDMRLATEAILQDLKRELIDGSILTTGQFDGLQALVKTGYHSSKGHHCRSMDSIVIDWNDRDFSGGAGITWNGKPVGNTYGFVDVLIAVVRQIKDRIRMAPALAAQPLSVGDIIIMAPQHLLRCLLDAYTCWSVCPGDFSSGNLLVTLNSYEGRRFRDSIMGGMFGDGKIFIDGFEIPLVAYEWNMINAVTGHGDLYVLTGRVGNVKTISGQYLDLTGVPASYPEAAYSYTDGGRLLTWLNRTQTCVSREVEMQPRLLMWAPWAQARFMDVGCDVIGKILSPDPWATSFYPETSFCTITCDEDSPDYHYAGLGS